MQNGALLFIPELCFFLSNFPATSRAIDRPRRGHIWGGIHRYDVCTTHDVGWVYKAISWLCPVVDADDTPIDTGMGVAVSVVLE